MRQPQPPYPPQNFVDPRRFIGQPLILQHAWGVSERRSSATQQDYVAMIAGYIAARVMHQLFAFNEWQWTWSMTGYGPYVGTRLGPTHGKVDTLQEAKQCVRRSFDDWLKWALAQPHAVLWSGANTRNDPPFDPPIDPESGTWWVDPSSGVFLVCNLWSINRTRDEVKNLVKALRDLTSNQPPQYGVYPDYEAGIVRLDNGERVITSARWGLPSPAFALKGRNSDPGITNVRNTESPHWKRWLGPEHRCLVPFTSFAEPETMADGKKQNVWFALGNERPIACFAGIWVPQWKSVRKVKEGETVNDLFAFLTTEANREVRAVHPKAMPVILTKPKEWETWLQAGRDEAMSLQRPLPDDSLLIVERGGKSDGDTEK